MPKSKVEKELGQALNKKPTKKLAGRLGFSVLELSMVLIVIAVLMLAVIKTSDIITQANLSAARELTMNSPVASTKGLMLWYETTLANSFLDAETKDGGSISTWYDHAGVNPTNPATLTAASGNQPLYMSGVINNLPVIRFNGSLLRGSNGFDFNALTAFFVVKYNNGKSGSQGPIFAGPNSWANSGANFQSDATNTNAEYVVQSGGTTIDSVTAITGPSANIGGPPHIVTFRDDNLATTGTQYVYIDGSQSNSLTPNATATKNFTQYCAGCSVATSKSLNGDIGEIILYNRALSDQERLDIDRYLGNKWGITTP